METALKLHFTFLPVYCETSLHVVYDPKVFTSLVNLDNIHEAGGELGVGLGLSIDLDQTLLHDRLNLFHAQGILDSIPDNTHSALYTPLHRIKQWAEFKSISSIRYYLAKQVSFLFKRSLKTQKVFITAVR